MYDTDDHWGGHAIPRGAGVWYCPAPTKHQHGKWHPRLCYGVFVGYSVSPGDIWSGDYLVISLDDFVDKPLARETPAQIFNHIVPHRTRTCELPRAADG